MKSSIGHSLTHLASLIRYANFVLACLRRYRNRHRLIFIIIEKERERNGYVYLVLCQIECIFVCRSFSFLLQIQLLCSRKLFDRSASIPLSLSLSHCFSAALANTSRSSFDLFCPKPKCYFIFKLLLVLFGHTIRENVHLRLSVM